MRRPTWVAALVALALLAAASPASAAFGLTELGVTFENANGTPATRAGSHPFAMTTTLGVNSVIVPGGATDPDNGKAVDGEVPDGSLKDLTVIQMPGLVGDQTAIPRCSAAEFASRIESYPACPDDTAVGYAAVKAEFETFPVGTADSMHMPVYNLEPQPGVAAKFGFVVANVPIAFDVQVSESAPYNLVVKLDNVPQALLVYGSKVTLWGNPADPAHDSLRGKCVGMPATPSPEPVSSGKCSVDTTERPLLTLPRSCGGPLQTLFSATSWQGASAAGPASTEGMSDCGLLAFSPESKAAPTAAAAESPTGLDFGLEVEDEGLRSPTGTAQSDIAKVVATLPLGLTANPSAAEGLGACTKAQYEAASLKVSGCPPSSKLGSVQISSPLLEEPIAGSLYLAEPDDPATIGPGSENPFDSLIATYLLVRSEKFGVFVKQAGTVVPDPRTGQLVSTFEDIPELPFSQLSVHFRAGPRAPLATPPKCGTYTTKVQLFPSSGGAPVESNSSFQVTSGPNGAPCPAAVPPFSPGFSAGTTTNNASSYSPFYMRLTRQDGEQEMTRFGSVLPPGVVGKLAGVARCPDGAIAAAGARSGRAELASPSCPAASRVGRVLAGAGVGPALTYVPGTIYLAGPFGGHPLSLAVITPAVAGPFDVGTVVTRVALDLDPTTGEVQVDGAASDPIPHILDGIPLKLRDLRVYVDRPDFAVNATSCDPEQVRATLFGSFGDPFNPADDAPVGLTDRYQAANCANLGFRPKVALKLSGGMKRSQHPELRSTVTYPYPSGPGYANIRKAVVTLPPTEIIDNAHVQNPCTRAQFSEDACPRGSILGRARAFTPLLDEPLEGLVYFRSNGGARQLPDIVADLRGEFRITLVGFVKSKNARILTTFANVPDAPVTKFNLRLFGGKRGLLANNRNLCARKYRLNVQLTGQNGARHNTNPVMATSCNGKKSKTKRR